MGPELPVCLQPLQVLHVSEQEEDIFALGMGLKQPVTMTTEEQAAIREPLTKQPVTVATNPPTLVQ